MKKFLAGCLLASTLFLVACDAGTPTSEQQQNNKQEQMNLQAVQTVGMPAIHNFWEKRQLKTILEMRDRPFASYTYITDFNGHLHFVCNSVGYGIPYSTQYTNPSQSAGYYEHEYALPQADPNALYSASSSEGTWVLCSNPKNLNQTIPVYVEPRIVVSPFKLPSIN